VADVLSALHCGRIQQPVCKKQNKHHVVGKKSSLGSDCKMYLLLYRDVVNVIHTAIENQLGYEAVVVIVGLNFHSPTLKSIAEPRN
jgi:hypothetical protein